MTRSCPALFELGTEHGHRLAPGLALRLAGQRSICTTSKLSYERRVLLELLRSDLCLLVTMY